MSTVVQTLADYLDDDPAGRRWAEGLAQHHGHGWTGDDVVAELRVAHNLMRGTHRGIQVWAPGLLEPTTSDDLYVRGRLEATELGWRPLLPIGQIPVMFRPVDIVTLRYREGSGGFGG